MTIKCQSRQYATAFSIALMTSALAIPMAVQAQMPAPSQFISYQGAPFGPGDRTMLVRVQLDQDDTSTNTQIWVVYSGNREEVANFRYSGKNEEVSNGKTGSDTPQGKAKIVEISSSGVAKAEFIFPHNDNVKPNVTDLKPKPFNRGNPVFYKVVKLRGNTVVQSPIVSFTMPDKLTIVNFGDSFSSGEGAPYTSGTQKWAVDQPNGEVCHRSNNAGQVRAVRAIRKENPGLAIKFKNVACSGAQINEGLLTTQLKGGGFLGGPDVNVPSQINEVSTWLMKNGYSTLNIAMVSGGGNDAGFGDYVTGYLILPFTLNATDNAAVRLRERIKRDIPDLYRGLKLRFDAEFEYDRVLVSEYPDPLRGSDGNYCDGIITTNPRSEFVAFNYAFLQPLNDSLRSIVETLPKFSYVSGTMEASRRHGICSSVPYFNRDIIESNVVQGDSYGIIHPNKLGHRKIYEPVFTNALRKAVKDIRKEWDLKAAKDAAKESAQAQASAVARARAAAEASARMARLVQMRSGSQVKSPVRVDLGASAPRLIERTAAERAQLERIVREARAMAANKPRPSDPEPDNVMRNDDESEGSPN